MPGIGLGAVEVLSQTEQSGLLCFADEETGTGSEAARGLPSFHSDVSGTHLVSTGQPLSVKAEIQTQTCQTLNLSSVPCGF